MLASCTAAHLLWIETRRTCPAGVLLTLKGVLALLCADDEAAAELVAFSWDELKSLVIQGILPWGDEFFPKVAEFDVMAGAGSEKGWEAAQKLVTELVNPPEDGGAAPKEEILAYSALCQALSLWLVGVVELHTAKVAKEAAEAEAAAAAAAAEAEAAAAAANEAPAEE